jgi:hypothetical protein
VERFPAFFLIVVLCSIAGAMDHAGAQRPRLVGDDQIVQQAELVASGDRVEIYQHGLRVAPAFLKLAEEAYIRLETLTGRKLDTATLGPRIRIYVSDAVAVSHVWRGYGHPRDPKGIVLLNARAYSDALRGANATYAHEMAHLFTWRYHSHTLREGLADYLALKIHPGAGVGPNPTGYDMSTRVSQEVLDFLGTTKPPPQGVVSDAGLRRSYYYASYRFVRYLIDTEGMDTFMELYDAEDTEPALTRLYRASREELVRRAME